MAAFQFTCAARQERQERRQRAYSAAQRRVIAAAVATAVGLTRAPAVMAADGPGTVHIQQSVRVPAAARSLNARKAEADSRPSALPPSVRDGVSRRVTALRQRHAQHQARQQRGRRYDLPAPPAKGHVPPRPDAGDVNEYLEQFGGGR